MMHQIIDPLIDFDDETEWEDLKQTTQQSAAELAIETPAVQQRDQVKYLPADTGVAYWGPGELMTFLITGEETGGAFFLADVSVAPGGGTPPHIHSLEDESFHLLEGKLSIQVGGNTIAASPGDFVYLPRGIAHSFQNTGDVTARAQVLVAPAGLEGFFVEVFEPAANRFAPPPYGSPDLIGRALAAAPKYGLELLPPR